MAKINQGYDCRAPIGDAPRGMPNLSAALSRGDLQSSGAIARQALAGQHKPHPGMCDLSNPICAAYVDWRIANGIR
jgi:hypothetical protein